MTGGAKSGDIRTLFVTQWFDPEPGALRGLPLAKWLSAHGHSVEVLTGVPNYPGGKVYDGYSIKPFQTQNMDGIRVMRVPLYPSHDSRILGRLANYGSFAFSAATLGVLGSKRADVAFVYHPPPTVGLPAVALKLLKGTPYVYHIADMWPESVIESGALANDRARRIVEAAIHRWCNFVYRNAAAITVLSPGFKRLLIERGVPADKIHIIYNWTDEEVFQPVPRDETLARELGLAGKFNIVYAGNLGFFQGIDTILDAAQALRDMPDVQIVVAGTGQKEEELKAAAASRMLENVRFLGRRQFWEMPKINALADALIVHLKDLPFFAATIPSKTQVSLASGRPVIMAVRGDAADIVRESRSGIVCDPEDPAAIAEAVRTLHRTTASEREAMGARGRDYYMRNMSLEIGGEQMDDLLRAVARRKGTAPAALPLSTQATSARG